MQDRIQRIVATAVELAEEGGFDNVRLREVAAASGVALGTLYRHFRSKEDLLLAALAQEVEELERRTARRAISGETPLERVAQFFHVSTRAFCRKPKLARAVLRAASSGDPELTEKVARFHGNLNRMIVGALRAEPSANGANPSQGGTATCAVMADVLQQVWFAALVGWAGGLHEQAEVVEKVRTAAELILRDR